MGDGDRTRMTSLEDWGSAIELHPQATPPWYASLRGVAGSFPSEGLEDYRRVFSQLRRSCRRDSNSQPTAYKAVALPLRHDSIYPSVRKTSLRTDWNFRLFSRQGATPVRTTANMSNWGYGAWRTRTSASKRRGTD